MKKRYEVEFVKYERYEVEAESFDEAVEKATEMLENDKYAFCDDTIDDYSCYIVGDIDQ